MPTAEIEYPLAGALLGPDFTAGGVYDLTRLIMPKMAQPRRGLLRRKEACDPSQGLEVQRTTSRTWEKIRCKYLTPGQFPTVIATSNDFIIPLDSVGNPIPSGEWIVTFSGITGSHDNCWLSSFLVDSNPDESAGELVIDITVTGPQGGGQIIVEVP